MLRTECCALAFIVTAAAAALSQTPTTAEKRVPPPAGNLNGVWAGDGDAVFKVKHRGNQFIWFGQGLQDGKFYFHRGKGTIYGALVQA